MTLKEASERFCISAEKLAYYEENRLIGHETLADGVPDYTEEELRKVSIIHDLLEAGMDIDVLQEYLELPGKKMAGRAERGMRRRVLPAGRRRRMAAAHRGAKSLSSISLRPIRRRAWRNILQTA